MKSLFLSAVFGMVLLLPLVTSAAAQETAHVVIVATTDVHGRAYHWNYVTDSEAPWGLTRVATVVDSLRARFPGQVIVLDVGDLIQGNPFASYYAYEREGEPHRVVDALNAVEYDVATVGNHDFDYGFGTLRRVLSDAAYPIVSANVYRLPRDTFAFQPEVVLSRSGARVGVTGLTTPGVMVWHKDKLAGQAYVRRILPSADRAMRRMEAAGADLRVAAVHSGMGMRSSYDTTGVGPENVAAQLAHLPVKPHVVLVGHSHARITDMAIEGVHFFQPSPWALSVAVVHVFLTDDGENGYQVTRVFGEEISVADVEPHPAVVGRLQRAHRSVREWLGTPIATMGDEWTGRYARAEDTPLVDFINETQMRATNADLSATPVFDLDASFGPNTVTLRDVAGVYPHENTLKAVMIDGETLRQYLERSAEYFLQYQAGGPAVNDSIPGYDFDIVSGVDYTIDLTQPAGSRIRQITRNGQLVTVRNAFSIALNSYRLGGGGGFEMLRDLPVVYDQGEDVRDLLISAIRQAGFLRRSAYFKPSWSIVPDEAAVAVRRAFEAVPEIAAPYTRTPTEESTPTVFAVPDTVEPDPTPPAPPASPVARMKFPMAQGFGEHPLGRLVADARRNGVRAHFALVLNSTVAAGLPAGPVTLDDIGAVLPDDLSLTRLTLTGEELYGVLEQVVAEDVPIAHVSGLEFWYDARRDAGSRIRRVGFPDGREIRLDGTYTLAVDSALVDGAAGFSIPQWFPSEAVGVSDVEVLVRYLTRLRQPVEAPAENRIHSSR